MRYSTLFYHCLHADYIQVDGHADYALERHGPVLYLYFEASDGITDWRSNLNFPAKPYRRMGKTGFLVHRGFLRVWQAIEPHLAGVIEDPTVRRVVIVGYSHGAAVAALCHEYVWYHRPDLRERLEGYGFGSPRVFWGLPSPACRRRWANFTVIRNIDDIVTHVPPAFLGFSHVGQMVEIGERGRYSRIDAHRPENILAELYREERADHPANVGLAPPLAAYHHTGGITPCREEEHL